jgi:hypothetical protein
MVKKKPKNPIYGITIPDDPSKLPIFILDSIKHIENYGTKTIGVFINSFINYRFSEYQEIIKL